MKPDPLDHWLEESNPVSSVDDSADATAATSTINQWTRLRGQQLRRRVWLRLGLAASVLFAVGGAAVSIAWKSEPARDNFMAEVQREESSVVRDTLLQSSPAGSPDALARPSTPTVASNSAVVAPSTPSRAEREFAEFGKFVQDAGPYLGKRWNQFAEQLSLMPVTTQRQVVDWVPRLQTPEKRHRAMMLVCQAAGESQRGLLIRWLQNPSLKEEAWSSLLNTSSLEQLSELTALATTPAQRLQVCQRLALATHSKQTRNQASEMLVTLAMQPQWRRASGIATKSMSPESIHELVLDLRSRDSRLRTAIGFLLASVPGKEIDKHLSSMVLQGRYRQPAYLALLSRNSPDANAFLNHALTQPTLAPAFHSARTHFLNIEPELRQWIQQTRGTFNEQTEINRTLFDQALLASTQSIDQPTMGELALAGDPRDLIRWVIGKHRVGSS